MSNEESPQENEDQNLETIPIYYPENDVIDANLVMEHVNINETDLCAINNKREQLDVIQRDLDDLMFKINSFIADSIDEYGQDATSGDVDEAGGTSQCNEKQDGPSEKELISNETSFLDDIYVSDGVNPPDINWDVVGPIIQKHIGDLQRLHNLNHMTKCVVKRIKNITKLSEAYIEQTKNEDKAESTEPK